jgi:undecaprenyl-diphosphatase
MKGLRLVADRALRLEISVLVSLGVIGALLWVFASIADEVMEGDTRQLDEMLLMALRDSADGTKPWGPHWVQEMARDFTALGSVAVLLLLTTAAIGYLRLIGKKHAAFVVLIAVIGGQVCSTLLKMGFDRARPDLVPHGSFVYTASFPSGHAMMSAVTYLTLGALLASVHSSIRIKAYILTLALVLTVLVGMSRVYLGVHWPTDVAAGWALGATWALLCSLVMRWLQKRGEVERPTSKADVALRPQALGSTIRVDLCVDSANMTPPRIGMLAVAGILFISATVLVGGLATRMLDVPPRGGHSVGSILLSVEQQGLGIIHSAEYERDWWRMSGVWEVTACKDRCMELHIDPMTGLELRRKAEKLKDELPSPNAQSPSAIARSFEVSNAGVITEIEFEDGAWEITYRESRGLRGALQSKKRRVLQTPAS